MTSNQVVKKNLSSTQVLKTLKVLLEGDFTMSEILERLNSQENKPVFNNSVVSKYINTCRYCGISIPKIHNKYYVANIPFGLNIDFDEQDLLLRLREVISNGMAAKYNRVADMFFEKLNRFSNKQIVRIEKNEAKYFYEAFESAIEKRRKIRLLFKIQYEMECTPVCITENKGKTYFNVLFNNKERFIAEERVAGLEILNIKSEEIPAAQNVVFKLSGDLVQRYTLREHESYITKNEDECVISNTGENKELLFSRLLRYDSSCEILNPIEYREEMKLLLNSALSNYGV